MSNQQLMIPKGFGGAQVKEGPARLRELIKGPGSFIMPGIVDALGARLVEQAGFEACYVTGAGISNVKLALADVGVMSMAEILDQVRWIIDAVDIPVVVDGDNGYGGPISVMRTVHNYERVGVAGIQLEDQPIPKRCGHFSGKRVVSKEEMLAKIDAATQARQNPDFVIIARTDARAVIGFEEAIERAHAYVEAGADVIFVEAPISREELERIPRELPGIPQLVNVVEGGMTPQFHADDYEAMGYRIILHANLVQRAMARAAQGVLAHLHSERESFSLHDRILSWRERQSLVNLDETDALENALQARWGYE